MRIHVIVLVLVYVRIADTAKLCNDTPHFVKQELRPHLVKPPKDGIAIVNRTYRLTCKSSKIDDAPTQTFWEYGETTTLSAFDITAVFLNSNIQRYEISDTGELMFNRVKQSDVGYYRCHVENRYCRVYSDTILLQVHEPVTVVEWSANPPYPVYYKQRVHLNCTIKGIPTPVAAWYKDGVKIPLGVTKRPTGHWMKVTKDSDPPLVTLHLTLRVGESGVYSCNATNTIVSNIPTLVKRIVAVSLAKHRHDYYLAKCDPSIVCDLCVPYVTLTSHKNNTRPHNQSFAHNATCLSWAHFTRNYVHSELCRYMVVMMICQYHYPSCSKPHPGLLCRESCAAVHELCLKHLPTLQTTNIVQCSTLLWRANQSAICARIPAAHATSSCYNNHGQWYRGNVSQSESGLACQPWYLTSPHNHTYNPATYPELLESGGVCRNPGGVRSRPWCYTVDSNVRWQKCDVKKCDDQSANGTIVYQPSDEDRRSVIIVVSICGGIITIFLSPGGHVSHDQSANGTIVYQPSDEDRRSVIIVVSICGGIITIFLCLLVAMCLVCHGYIHCRHLPWSRDPQYDLTSQSDENDIDLEKIPTNELYTKITTSHVIMANRLSELEYPRNDIIFMRDLGRGAFGRVFQAKAPHIIKGVIASTVAVKMLKDDATEELRQEFEREAMVIAEMKHPNIITLLGVCRIGVPMCMLLEFMCHGDLHEFLRLSGPEHYILRRNTGLINRETLENETLDSGVKSYICEQIAAGMMYISQKGYIHRDLATRNCLVTDKFTVKISDFGLTRRKDSTDCYKGSENDAIPIRWMPIEAILFNKFTTESDVWSFGIVMWEIFSFAHQPYGEFSHEEVIAYIKSGRVLQCPIGTPQALYDLMIDCWHHKPTDRPSFSKLHKSLYMLHMTLSKSERCSYHNHFLEI